MLISFIMLVFHSEFTVSDNQSCDEFFSVSSYAMLASCRQQCADGCIDVIVADENESDIRDSLTLN